MSGFVNRDGTPVPKREVNMARYTNIERLSRAYLAECNKVERLRAELRLERLTVGALGENVERLRAERDGLVRLLRGAAEDLDWCHIYMPPADPAERAKGRSPKWCVVQPIRTREQIAARSEALLRAAALLDGET